MRAIVLAGGQGTRLRPYTFTLPKPLMPVGGEMPILEVIVRQLARCGFDRLTLAVNHKATLLRAFFGDGADWGIDIDYSLETEPLSTIGPLTLVEDLPEHFLVMNGDLLCDLDYGAFLRDHVAAGTEVSVATCERTVHSDFGVIETDAGQRITGFREKPVYTLQVSMGVYALARSAIERLPQGRPYGFDTLMLDSIRAGRPARAVAFPGYWLDIGRPEDFERAQQEFPILRQQWRL
jgi:NDP-sugar pyrophosphorylase family protein